MEFDALRQILGKNILKVAQAMGWTQARMAQELGVVEATVSNYVHGTRWPSLEFLLLLRQYPGFREKGIEVTIDALLDPNFTPIPNKKRRSGPVVADGEHDEFLGNYICYFFDQSKRIYSQDTDRPRELRFGVISVYKSLVGYGEQAIVAKAAFFKEEDAEEAVALKAELDDILSPRENVDLNAREQSIKDAFKAHGDRVDLTYDGGVSFSDHHVFINISSENYGDNALIILYSPQKRSDAEYIGGLGSVASVARGRLHMPSAQKMIVSKFALGCSNEDIAEYLSMYPEVEQVGEAKEICEFCSKLYAADSPLRSSVVDEGDRQVMLQRRLEQVMRNHLEKNVYCVGSVSEEEDLAVYRLIDRFRG